MPRLHWVSWGERDVECFPSVVLHQYDLRLVINDILCPFAGVPHRFPSLCQFLCWNLKGFVNRCTGGGGSGHGPVTISYQLHHRRGQAQQARQSGCPGFQGREGLGLGPQQPIFANALQGNPPWPHDVLPTVETSWVNTRELATPAYLSAPNQPE